MPMSWWQSGEAGLLNVFNVKAYGAVGNDSTDDTAAFNAAKTAAGAGRVYAPTGTYKIVGGLSFPTASLFGDGLGSVIHVTAQTGAALDIGASGDFQYGRVFEKFQVIGDGIADAGKTHTGISLHGTVLGASFRDISISLTGGPPLKLATNAFINSFGNLTLFRPVGADTNDVPYLHLLGVVNGNNFTNVILRSVDASVDALSGCVRLEYSAGDSYVPSRNTFYSLSTEGLHIPENGSLVCVDGAENAFHNYMDYDSVASSASTTNTALMRFVANGALVTGGNVVNGPIPGAFGGGSNIAWGVVLEGNGNRVQGSASYPSQHVLLKSGAARNYVDIGGRYSGSSVVTDNSGQRNVIMDSSSGVLAILGLPIYANNAAAVAGALPVGARYRTGADPDPVMVVH